jgi:hypothetical protein
MITGALSVSQDRWNEIFEAGANYDGEQLFIDFDRKTIIGSPLGAGWVHYKVHYTSSPIPPKGLKLNLGGTWV